MQPVETHQRARRVRFKHPVRVATIDGEPRAWRTLAANLSREGLFVRMPQPLEPGTRVAISLEAAGQTLPFAQGEVRWCRQTPSGFDGRHLGCGVRFTGFSHPRASELVQYLVSSLDTGRPLKAAPLRRRRWPWAVAAGLAVGAVLSGLTLMFAAPEPPVLPSPTGDPGPLGVLGVASRVNGELASLVSPAEDDGDEPVAEGAVSVGPEDDAAVAGTGATTAPVVGGTPARVAAPRPTADAVGAPPVLAKPEGAEASSDAVAVPPVLAKTGAGGGSSGAVAVPRVLSKTGATPASSDVVVSSVLAKTGGEPAPSDVNVAPPALAERETRPAVAPRAAEQSRVPLTAAVAPGQLEAGEARATHPPGEPAAAPGPSAQSRVERSTAQLAAEPSPPAGSPLARPFADVGATRELRSRKPAIGGQLALPSGAAAAVSWTPSPDGLEVRPTLRGEAKIARVFALSEPPRLVFDIDGEAPKRSLTLDADSHLITRVRLGKQGPRTRVVFDLASPPHHVRLANGHAVVQF